MSNNLAHNKKENEIGLTLIGDVFKAENGFNYASGFRNFGNLKIVEDIAAGTAVAYLSGIKVFDEKGTLIIDCKMAKGFHFEREAVRKVVLNELLKMLLEVHRDDKNFNKEAARVKIDHHLKQAYYESSYMAISSWAKDLGIFNN
ncbi:hypothetical protein [Gaetbulibacter saemankumensis]|uniref:hypothetical protein n=1 Tax=Gaetbulibacter saemankumensis TaxID=311208 RepID=UPI0003FE79C0|nr:hypothetical protein [Gaetbulibacter saemankumensis]